TPPVSDWAWHLQPKDKIRAKPFEAEIDAAEITAWSEACLKAEGYFNPERDEYPDGSSDYSQYKQKNFCGTMKG
ncbi:MAG: hypothetical protein RBR27_05810, partial [Bacilli bacterium]|nr:hypothetical protein [Bacilli bacterium]